MTTQGTEQTALQSRKRALLQLNRRESLYPADLSGPEGRVVELFARSIEIL